MSCYYSTYTDYLTLKCDVCGKKVKLYKGETDRLLKHSWMNDNGWICRKANNGKWMDVCNECKTAIEDWKRKSFIERGGR